jgi:hypothetical protein
VKPGTIAAGSGAVKGNTSAVFRGPWHLIPDAGICHNPIYGKMFGRKTKMIPEV